MTTEEQQKTRIPTIDPEKEPEYVGAHSAVNKEQCTHYVGEFREDITRCENAATHTIVMYDGSLHEMASCDECGQPEDVTVTGREWSA